MNQTFKNKTMSLPVDEILPILSKSNKTRTDFEQIIDIWHEFFTKKENTLLEKAQQLNNEQNQLNSKTEQFMIIQKLLYDIEKSNNVFATAINTLRKYNDELENDSDKLTDESKKFLPNQMKTDVDRTDTYELMENVDKEIENVGGILNNLNKTLNIDEERSIVQVTSDIQTCFQDMNEIGDKMKLINLNSK
ncbi:unnamed protein product [Didymodactylos carnosus]|uniref:Uncharacterized protein n=1 Tax=Didymodactylos carnosus TaxID=1234261 RepID=A0A813VIK6_9BILA|nr:unnamed protein product [Didymodactylos carnosus]CAF0838144.1 unnamed protein product [Didymodactylos carnosus]CAF3518650.1 unnamed protein product [Didymodactylos carnosus]CAF3625410.1 unnamed protein product [Didymodactylos carnosus]